MNFNVIDIIIVVALIIFGIVGYKKGLIGNLVGLISLVASIALAWILYPIVSDMLMGIGVRDYIYNTVLQRVSLNHDNGAISEFLPKFLQDLANSGVDMASAQISGGITDILLNIVSFLIILIVSRFIILIGEKALKVASRLPVLNGFNRVCGAIVGLIKGVIVIYIICMLFVVILPDSISNEDDVKSSYFINKMNNKNPVVGSIIKREQLKFEQNGE